MTDTEAFTAEKLKLLQTATLQNSHVVFSYLGVERITKLVKVNQSKQCSDFDLLMIEVLKGGQLSIGHKTYKLSKVSGLRALSLSDKLRITSALGKAAANLW